MARSRSGGHFAALRTGLTAVVAILSLFDLTSLIRTVSNFADATNNVYVLNEILAPAAGRTPGATFVGQYSNLFGWVLVPFRHLVSAWDLAQLATIFLSSLAVLSVLLGVAIAFRSMSRPAIWVAAGIVIPLTCVTVEHGAQPLSSIAEAMQELSIRMFSAMLLSFLGLEVLTRIRAGAPAGWRLSMLGALAGLIAWNSQDFGIAVTVAYFPLLVVALPSTRLRRCMSLWVAGLLAGAAVYPLVCLFAGTPIKPAYFGLFSRGFAGGFASSPIQVPGPVLVVLPLLLSSAGVGWCLLWRQRRQPTPDGATNERAIMTLALVGTWATAGFVYYLNRSYASGQLQVLLLPCGVCLVALLSLGRQARLRVPASGRTSVDGVRAWLGFLPVALLVALGFASALQSPNPVHSVTQLADAKAQDGFAAQLIPLSVIQAAKSYVSDRGGSLGYFGNNGSYVHLWTGLRDDLLFDDPAQVVVSPTLRRAGLQVSANACRPVARDLANRSKGIRPDRPLRHVHPGQRGRGTGGHTVRSEQVILKGAAQLRPKIV